MKLVLGSLRVVLQEDFDLIVHLVSDVVTAEHSCDENDTKANGGESDGTGEEVSNILLEYGDKQSKYRKPSR